MENEFIVGGIKYRINRDGTSVTVIGCDEKSTGIKIIAHSVLHEGKEYSVTKIGQCAFYNCRDLASVVIPDSVTKIGQCAFEACCGLASVVIPDSVTMIGNKAFMECTRLTTINVPDSVTEIGALPFVGCRSLKAIYVSDGNTRYDSRDDCNAIIETESNTLIVGCKSTVIPNSVTMIGDSAFNGCRNLASVVIPDSVTMIGKRAFMECTRLTTINVPDSVTEIGALAFFGCRSLKAIYVSDGNTRYDSRDDCNAIIETATNTLIVGCKSTVIPNSVTKIGDFVFYGCRDLASVVIPDSVTKIGGWAFAECTRLTTINVPDSVTWIGPCAFSGTPWEKRMRQIAKK